MLPPPALSDDLLVCILQYLDLNDLVTVRRVNKQFRRAADNDLLFRQVRVNRHHRLNDVFFVLNRHRDAIEAFIMENVSDSNAILNHLSRCLNLRKLKLVGCDGERGIRSDILGALISRASSVHDLCLKNCKLDHFPKMELKTLVSLVIMDNLPHRHPLDYKEPLSVALRNNPDTLTCLRLRVQNMKSEERNNLFDLVRRCSKLRVFHFQYPHADEISEANLRCLLSLRNLMSLSVVVSPILSTRVRQQFVDWLSANKLRKLELGGKVCRLVLSTLPKCDNLEVLRLTSLTKRQPFLQVDAAELLHLLAPCTRLREISLLNVSVMNAKSAILQLPARLPELQHAEIEVNAELVAKESDDDATSLTPLKIEFNLLPNYALETHALGGTTSYMLFKSDRLLTFLTSVR